MTEKVYQTKLKKIQIYNIHKKQKAKLKEEKTKYKRKRKMPSTSKLILLGVILLCLEIVVFCEYAMVHLGDTSALYALIGIPVAIAPTVVSYYMKSKAENTEGGIVYEAAMAEIQKSQGNTSADEEQTEG